MPTNANSWMTYKDKSDLDGAVQSRGRDLGELEQAFANALEAIFAEGIHDMEKVAENLSQRGIQAPSDRDTNWSLDKLSSELQHLDVSLDAAYEKDGYGA